MSKFDLLALFYTSNVVAEDALTLADLPEEVGEALTPLYQRGQEAALLANSINRCFASRCPTIVVSKTIAARGLARDPNQSRFKPSDTGRPYELSGDQFKKFKAMALNNRIFKILQDADTFMPGIKGRPALMTLIHPQLREILARELGGDLKLRETEDAFVQRYLALFPAGKIRETSPKTSPITSPIKSQEKEQEKEQTQDQIQEHENVQTQENAQEHTQAQTQDHSQSQLDAKTLREQVKHLSGQLMGKRIVTLAELRRYIEDTYSTRDVEKLSRAQMLDLHSHLQSLSRQNLSPAS